MLLFPTYHCNTAPPRRCRHPLYHQVTVPGPKRVPLPVSCGEKVNIACSRLLEEVWERQEWWEAHPATCTPGYSPRPSTTAFRHPASPAMSAPGGSTCHAGQPSDWLPESRCSPGCNRAGAMTLPGVAQQPATGILACWRRCTSSSRRGWICATGGVKTRSWSPSLAPPCSPAAPPFPPCRVRLAGSCTQLNAASVGWFRRQPILVRPKEYLQGLAAHAC